MTQPRVCAVMLVDGRPEMVARAIRSFEAQTYPQRELLLYDTGSGGMHYPGWANINHIETSRQPGDTIGTLRNLANTCAGGTDADIIVHWDSDDWSAPERIAEQVALLTGGPKVDAVGYNDMAFWDSRVNEAWLYQGAPRYMLGTSLAYWRETWKRKQFPAVNTGEDTQWQMGLQSLSISTVQIPDLDRPNSWQPRMVCSIHGGNISSHIDQRSMQWLRAPHLDDYCRGVFA